MPRAIHIKGGKPKESPLTVTHRAMSIEGEATVTIEASRDEESGENEKPSMARFAMTANTGSPMRLKGWKHPAVMDMEGIQIGSQKLPVRMGHDPMMGVGHTESVGVDGGILRAAGVISRSTEAARDVRESAKNGFPWKTSIGADADEVEFVKAGETAFANGVEHKGPVNIVRRSTLGEISFVDIGADPHTDAMIAEGEKKRIAAAKDGGDDDGDSPSTATSLEAGKRKLSKSMDWIEAENARQEEITALAVQYGKMAGVDIKRIKAIAAKAHEENWTPQKAELEMLRLTRAQPVHTFEPPATPKVLEASLIMACIGQGGDEFVAKDRDYGPDVAQEAWQYRNRGLKGTICAALEASGVRVPHGNTEFYSAILDNQRQPRIQAASGGFSTVNLPGILGNIANKVLLEAFTRVDATYDRIADQADFSNFYMHSIFRLQATGDFAKVNAEGELKHGTLEQDYFTNKLDTSGLMLVMTRQQIINDDLNSFRSLTAQLARRARIAVEKELYLVIAESADVFYTAAQGNRLINTPLDITGLGSAEAAMLGQTDKNGDPIYAQPRFVVVPSTLKFMAEQIWSSQLVNDFTTGKARPTDNPYRGRFEPISSPFLNSATIPGSSSTTWYLLADPLMLPAFQVAYLDGRRAPTIESADTLFNTLGLQFRAYWDFGVAQLDNRGAVKATALT